MQPPAPYVSTNVKPQIPGQSVVAEAPCAQPMTTKHLVIDMSFITENTNNPIADMNSPEYADLLGRELQLKCSLRNSDAPATPVVFLNEGLASQSSNGQYTLLNGGAIIITSGLIIIESAFEQGRPVGLAEISFILPQEIKSYAGTLAVKGEQFNILCIAHLIDSLCSLRENRIVIQQVDSTFKPLNARGNILLGGVLIEGTWREGKPEGIMSHHQIFNDRTSTYFGPLSMWSRGSLNFFGCHGNAQEVIRFNSGGTIIAGGKWDKNRFVEKTEEVIIASYRNPDLSNQPRPEPPDDTQEIIGIRRKGQFNEAGKLIDGREINYEEETTTTTIYRDWIVIRKIKLSRTTGEATINWPEEKKSYCGPIFNELPQGNGKMSFSDKSFYVGDFVAGVREGLGEAHYPDQTVYSGQYVNDKRHGHGLVTWGGSNVRAGHTYNGAFENDKRTGQGHYTYLNSGKSIKGEWKDSQLSAFSTDDGTYTGTFNDQFEQLTGKGKFVSTDGTVSYEGEWKNGLFDGVVVTPGGKYKCLGSVDDKNQLHGVISIQTSRADGTWSRKTKEAWKNEVHAQQTAQQPIPRTTSTQPAMMAKPVMLTNPDGSQFEGIVDDAHQPVEGIMMRKDGIIIKGRWSAGKLTEGAATYTDGSTYTGSFDDMGLPHGNGEADWIDSEGQKNHYKGEFDHGQPHGKGTLTIDGRFTYQGIFDRGMRHGQGSITFTDKTFIEGKWAADKLVEGVLTSFDRTTYKGQFDDKGWPHGQGEYQWIDDQGRENSYQGEIDKGCPHGQGTHIIDGGLQFYQGPIKHGVYDGWGTLQFQNGQSSYEGYFKNGNYNPIAATIKMNNVTYRPFSNYPIDDVGRLSFYGEALWSNGQRFTGRMKDGIPHGHGTLVLPGKLIYEGAFLNGQYDGAGKIEFANGDMYEGIFVDGQVNGPGTFYKNNGKIYSANFTPETAASLTFDQGTVWSGREDYSFEGQIMRGRPFGYGTLTLLNSGIVFEGMLFRRQS